MKILLLLCEYDFTFKSLNPSFSIPVRKWKLGSYFMKTILFRIARI